jgi:hypothetical protein
MRVLLKKKESSGENDETHRSRPVFDPVLAESKG